MSVFFFNHFICQFDFHMLIKKKKKKKKSEKIL